MKLKRVKSIDKRSKKVRKGDKVVVRTGNYKGQTGTVLRVTDKGVIVQGLNLKKKHVKKTEQNPKGGIVEIEGPIHISNVAVCDEAGKAIKLKMEVTQEGERNLVWMKDGQKTIYRSMKRANKSAQ